MAAPTDGDQLILLPAQGWTDAPGAQHGFGPVPRDSQAAEWLEDRLGRIARAQNLLKIGGLTQVQQDRGTFGAASGRRRDEVQVEFLQLSDEDDADGELETWQSEGIEFHEGDLLAVRVHNGRRESMDVSLIFVDSGFGISPLFPSPDTVVDNRVPPGEELLVGPMVVEGDSFGLEHLVIIALRSEGRPVDFSWLAQDSLERVHAARGEGDTGMASPLSELLQQAMFAHGSARGMRMSRAADSAVRVVSWQTRPGTDGDGG